MSTTSVFAVYLFTFPQVLITAGQQQQHGRKQLHIDHDHDHSIIHEDDHLFVDIIIHSTSCRYRRVEIGSVQRRYSLSL